MELINNEIDGGFVAVPNETVDDTNLDFMSLGLLLALGRHKSGFHITLDRIGKKYGYGRKALAAAMGNLQVNGYTVKFRTQSSETGQWSTVLVVSMRPMDATEILYHQAALEDRRSISAVQGVEPTEEAWRRAEERITKLSSPR